MALGSEIAAKGFIIYSPMQEQLSENKIFKKIIQTDTTFNSKEFEDCIFLDCDFSNSDFVNSKFNNCEFGNCNLSMVKLKGTQLNGVKFKDCKILGVNFSDCNDFMFSLDFDTCLLDYCSFMRKKMVRTNFKGSSVKNAIFTEANLTQAVFERTDLQGTVFSQTLLKAADFTTALNFSIDPAFNTVKKAKFSLYGLPGLLDRYDIKVEH